MRIQETIEIHVMEALQNDWNSVQFNFLANYDTSTIIVNCILLQLKFLDAMEIGARLRGTPYPLAEKDQRHRVTFWFCCFFLFCVFEMDFLDEFCHYASPNYCRHTP